MPISSNIVYSPIGSIVTDTVQKPCVYLSLYIIVKDASDDDVGVAIPAGRF